MNNTSKITRPITIRVKNETAEYFKERPLNRMVESLQRYMEIGQIVSVDGELEVKGAFMVDKGIVTDLKIMGELCDMSFDDLFKELHRAIDDNEIDLKNGHFSYRKVGQPFFEK